MKQIFSLYHSWPGKLCRVLASYFVECLSFWVCWCFLITRFKLRTLGRKLRELVLCPSQDIMSGSMHVDLSRFWWKLNIWLKRCLPGFSTVKLLLFSLLLTVTYEEVLLYLCVDTYPISSSILTFTPSDSCMMKQLLLGWLLHGDFLILCFLRLLAFYSENELSLFLCLPVCQSWAWTHRFLLCYGYDLSQFLFISFKLSLFGQWKPTYLFMMTGSCPRILLLPGCKSPRSWCVDEHPLPVVGFAPFFMLLSVWSVFPPG